MTERFLPGDPPIPLTLRRRAGVRNFSLRVAEIGGAVTLTIPARAAEAAALEFARSRAGWIRAALARAVVPVIVGPGAVLPFEGRQVTVTEAPVRVASVEGATLLVPRGGNAGLRAAAFLRLAARARLLAASEAWATALGRGYARLSIADPKARWGSCSQKSELRYSWRLVMAPPEVLDYVAAHEVAHLAQMNHSPAYWAVLAGLLPGYQVPRHWLRQNGAALHRFDFGTARR